MEIDSARQLELLDKSPAGPERGQEGLVVASDRLCRPNPGLKALQAEPAKPSTPSGGTHSAADRAALTKPSTGGQRTLPRLAVSPGEAAEILGVSRDYFDEHVIGELRVVRRGRRILVALVELERWLDRNATRGIVARRA